MTRTYPSAAIEKAEREYQKACERRSDILTRPDDDPIWADETFWQTRWGVICEREYAALEKAAALWLKHYEREEQQRLAGEARRKAKAEQARLLERMSRRSAEIIALVEQVARGEPVDPVAAGALLEALRDESA